MEGKRKAPSGPAVADKVKPVASLLAVTCAPATAAPDGSRTVPARMPSLVCAHAAGSSEANRKEKHKNFRTDETTIYPQISQAAEAPKEPMAGLYLAIKLKDEFFLIRKTSR